MVPSSCQRHNTELLVSQAAEVSSIGYYSCNIYEENIITESWAIAMMQFATVDTTKLLHSRYYQYITLK